MNVAYGQGTVIVEDDFIAASVQGPLVSLGRLLQKGWRLGPAECESGVHLRRNFEYEMELARFSALLLELLGAIWQDQKDLSEA